MADYTRDKVEAALNHAADLIQAELDPEGDELAYDVANFVVNASFSALDNPDATLIDVFIDQYGAEDEDGARIMAQERCFLD